MEDEAIFDRVALDHARNLFQICDWEKKGFIIESDMKRLKAEFADLGEEQLGEVFQGLDKKGNKKLTLDEFVKGIAEFLSQRLQPHPHSELRNLHDELSMVEGDHHMRSGHKRPFADPDDQFEEFLDALGGAEEVFQDQTAVRALWTKLRKDQPELIPNFEGLLRQVGEEIQQKTNDFTSLESILKQRLLARDEQVQVLYEEMEAQLRVEKERIVAEERRKAKKLQEDLERRIAEKDREIDALRLDEDSEHGRAQTGNAKEQLMKERDAFLREKEEMERDLESARKAIQIQKDELEKLRQRSSMDLIDGRTSDSERDESDRDLEELRRINRKIVDERNDIRALQQPAYPPPIRRYDPSLRNSPTPTTTRRCRVVKRGIDYGSIRLPAIDLDDPDDDSLIMDDYDEDSLPKCMQNLRCDQFDPSEVSLMSELGEALKSDRSIGWSEPCSERIGPLGGNEEKIETTNGLMQWRDYQTVTPDRMFKVVFLGDSGVGKSCFVQRFCYNRYDPTFSATIGVDFQVKTITVEGRITALQLWDTAGQERYRSITKQYFRKSDGVVLMYDVTSELSFLNLRNWLQCIREGLEDDCVLCLIGNKIDLCPTEESRVVKYADGQRLAEQCGALFFEASAQSGFGVHNSMQMLAVLLREKEDNHLEKVLRLEMEIEEKPSRCCSGGGSNAY